MIAIGIIFLAIGIIGLALTAAKKKRCSEKITAEIIDVFVQIGTKGDKSYYPVYKYWYEGNDYKTKSNIGFSTPHYKVGDQVDVYIDPYDPKKVYSPKDSRALTIVFVIALAIGIFVVCLGIKKYNDLKEVNDNFHRYFKEDYSYDYSEQK